MALLYANASTGSTNSTVYSRATPIGVNLSRPRPPARGGPTIDERVVGLVEPPRRVGPPLAGGLHRARTGLSERLWGHPHRRQLKPPQATRKGWPYYRRTCRRPCGAVVYSRATPCVWPVGNWPGYV